MNIKVKMIFSLLLILISRFSDSLAQSVFNKDSLIVKGKTIYIIQSKLHYGISTNKQFLYSLQENKRLTDNTSYIEGDFIDRGYLARAYITTISRERAMALARNQEMTLMLQFNNSGNVEAVKFIVPKNNIVSPEDLVTIDEVIKSSVHIKLPTSHKYSQKLEPYRYPFDFLRMAMYQTEQTKAEPLHSDWVDNDIRLLTQVADLDKGTPQNVVGFFNRITNNYSRNDTLGFGWTHSSTGMAAGYISVNLDYYTHNEKIVSYSLSSQIPYRTDLVNKYDSLLHSAMPIDSGNSVYYKFGENHILSPLPEIARSGYKNKKAFPLQMLRYMSPLSGITYGYYGGIYMNMIQNRAMFNEIIKKLTPDQIVALMYSINPASRLTAIEYYYRHRELFNNHASIESWIKKVYSQNPMVESINGCFIDSDKPENLINNVLKWHDPFED